MANQPLFNKFLGNTGNDELEYCLKRDVICAIAVGIEEDNGKRLIGLWADFNRQVIEETNVRKYLLKYLPSTRHPPEYPVCKKRLDDLLKVMRDLGLRHIFLHSDKQVYD